MTKVTITIIMAGNKNLAKNKPCTAGNVSIICLKLAQKFFKKWYIHDLLDALNDPTMFQLNWVRT